MPPSIETRVAQQIAEKIAAEVACRPQQVLATAALLDEGATVPFIARYRKEITGGLDDIQLRLLDERLTYLRELEDRRRSVLASIDEQGKLSPELAAAINAADTKQRLEDLYLPYKPKRRSKAQAAREAGLAPLAEALLANPLLAPEVEAERFLNADAGFGDVRSVLDGARQILMEQFSEDAALLGELRSYLEAHGFVKSTLVAGKEIEAAKFQDYFAYAEALLAVPSHRALALFRGRNEGLLQLALVLDNELDDKANGPNPCESRIARRFGIVDQGRPADRWLAETVRWTWRIKASLHLELELMNALRERAEAEAIRVFGANLHDLLLAAPAGKHATMGLDPGLRTGVKVAVVDPTGKLLDTATIYPHEPRRDWDGALHTLAQLARRHQVALISIGNGTASRETDRLVGDLIRQHADLHLGKIVVSEAGASVYSASEYASREFPDLDVSLRGAVSIARRLQDPLAELVKIDPKSIGVGQYQHDVSQSKLAKALNGVVEDCVNAVGVDVNTASVALLTRVSGLSPTLAANIVTHRDKHGAFRNRQALRGVPRLGDKTFELAAGFLRVHESDNPLDRSAVHPEAYPLVERILADIRKGIGEVIGDSRLLRTLVPEKFIDDRFGLPTVRDILRELEKPGRDPRPEFRAAAFREGVESAKDLQPGMILEGVVTNVANFGAFVDIGVHQDGLVHISAIADRFVKDPRTVVKAGDVVKVKVLEVDLARQRIALSMRLADALPNTPKAAPAPASARARQRQQDQPQPGSAMASAFARLKR
ncbi:MAG: RNA-binding transcriptional accessory protein [Candidatus Accumulibacter sp.]|uniref:Tex family protein n=2 Tax=Accumulibacter sp. TaxID=2053492 RepID=UPI00258FA3BF|nr:Tex family protein [Accumulibacter sp.]MBK8114062.1 RNA-binding transcriptional accessory protein [Accumulibacter sp.]